jgi:hypothetical protein
MERGYLYAAAAAAIVAILALVWYITSKKSPAKSRMKSNNLPLLQLDEDVLEELRKATSDAEQNTHPQPIQYDKATLELDKTLRVTLPSGASVPSKSGLQSPLAFSKKPGTKLAKLSAGRPTVETKNGQKVLLFPLDQNNYKKALHSQSYRISFPK